MQNLIENGKFSVSQYIILGICLLLVLSDGFDATAWAYTADRVQAVLLLRPGQLGDVRLCQFQSCSTNF